MHVRCVFALLIFAFGASPAGADQALIEKAYNTCADEGQEPKIRLRDCTTLIRYMKENGVLSAQFRLQDVYVSRAQVRYNMGKPEEALSDLEEATSYIDMIDPRSNDNRLRGWPPHYVYVLRGQVEIALERYQDAIESLKKADQIMQVGKFANDSEKLAMASSISRLTGTAYTYLGQPQVGLAVLNLAIEQDPSSAEAYLVRAAIHKSLGQMAEADADLAKAKALGK